MSEKISKASITSGVEEDKVETYGDDPALEAKLRRKFDLMILPIVTGIFLLAFIDRANAGNARILGMAKDLDLSGYRFNIAMTGFYCSYIVLEIPANMMCKWLGPKIWLSFLSFGFGIVTMCTAFITSYEGLVVGRVFLGALESGIMPGISFTLSQFYRRHELATRIGFYSSVAPLSGAFGGLLATGLNKVPKWGMVHGWRNIFFFEGLLSIILSVISYTMLPKSPATASGLTPEERSYAAWRIAEESRSHVPQKTSSKHFKMAVFNINVNIMAFACTCTFLTMTSLSIFLPSILNSMGYSPVQSQLMSVPPFAWSAAICLAIAYISDRTKSRGLWLLTIMPFTAAGFLVLILATKPAILYFATFLTLTGSFTCAPMLVAWAVDNTAGSNVRAVSSAYVVSIANLGGIVATWTYLLPDAPRYISGHAINFGAAVVCCVLMTIATIYLRWQNKLKARGHYDYLLQGLNEEEQAALGHNHPSYKYTP
ncbi:hypothetical protein D8B26_001878 [Coccidioides posadasii str. Silveira]|uniref:Uncharacterized protein n=3 Tax=Coccidioides posadasii TaxID=199306 RepID=E9CWQ8_COCPS|nr:major facilitator superfamily protein [Coccidioides posadasii C735 delta SOWgp]EER23741.1 major facilitator superfamily protein [Coccidioides posadasii C735 delta SOWgp]EFW21734.1 conserved hypothetical protein [Coccidioides posadasii str. Silveira]KMM65203.1 hypothetical protein CPAG_01555 [Coccidioides posadasii RMSCC 3488]QVM07174.1 hypothetical protein D8B26_001878 [Coccidioides posadasii str. Silveira]|eukprot:XP_003065886.1 major facilitator superfamily protein [Coccidioides posadasii C735 delta SOWgp]